MHLYFFLSLFILFSFNAFALNSNYIEVSTLKSPPFIDGRGENGPDGINGADARDLDCNFNYSLKGDDGTDGSNGENGERGRDVIVYHDDPAQLAHFTLDLSGGEGGSGGFGGFGGKGCNGGVRGNRGSHAERGRDGRLGDVYLFKVNQSLEQIRGAKVISLIDLHKKPVVLGYHTWKKTYGAKSLFAPDSRIPNFYFTHKNTHFSEVSLDWKAPIPVKKYENTKMAISLDSKGKFHLNNYSGALLDYKIKRSLNKVRIQVYQIIEEGFVKKLSFGRMRSSGEALNLEIHESSYVPDQIKSEFRLTLFELKENPKRYVRVNHFIVPDALVKKEGRMFMVNIGKLKFPARLKRKGVKLKVNLSVYRKYFHHTRSVGLSGKFKI